MYSPANQSATGVSIYTRRVDQSTGRGKSGQTRHGKMYSPANQSGDGSGHIPVGLTNQLVFASERGAAADGPAATRGGAQHPGDLQ
eukprot:8325056-Pyramimonas_sp.AAC.1